MAYEPDTCPKCDSTNTTVIEIHNPETTKMYAEATLHCNKCGHTWEDITASPYYYEQRELGIII